ncbi:MAG: hypothetical protein KDD55_11320, partial [Bdellovibrionales bacterium]|nr:hypothetical protein [Bdellovibrionales bacterium]
MSVNRLCTILRYVLCAFFVTCLTIFSIPSTSFAQLGITGYVNFDEDQIVAGLTTNATVSIHKAGGTLGSTNVVVHVILPTGFSLANATGGCSEPTAGAVICNVGSLLAGQSFNSVLALKTAPNILIEMAGGDISVGPQVAEMIGSVSQDGEPNVALSSDEIMVDEYADLHIQNFSSDLEVSVGDNFTYTIFVRNFGPSTARDIIVEDYIATEGANQNQHVQVNANGCSLAVRTEGGLIDEFDCNFASSTGVFQLSTMGANWLNPMTPEIPGSDPPEIDKGLMIITINAQVTSISDGEQGLLENSATVASFTPDPNTGNNISEVQLLVDGEADLSIS